METVKEIYQDGSVLFESGTKSDMFPMIDGKIYYRSLENDEDLVLINVGDTIPFDKVIGITQKND